MNKIKQISLSLMALVTMMTLSGVAAHARVVQPTAVPSVPEPGTVGMLIAGGVAAGLMLRARRK